MKKQRRKKPKQEPSDLGPLAWLAGVTSFGLDCQTPRPPFPKIHESRFLGLDARRKGYTIDPGRPLEKIELIAAVPGRHGPAEILTQRHRGVLKRCFKPEGSERLIPYLEEVLLPDPAALSQHLTSWPPRPIMPTDPDSDSGGLPWYVQETVERGMEDYWPNQEGAEQIVGDLLEVQFMVRLSFLSHIWRLNQHPGEAWNAEKYLSFTIDRITEYCTGDLITKRRLGVMTRLFAPDNLDVFRGDRDAMLIIMGRIESLIWRLRAPVFPRFANPNLIWVGAGYPGIIWAEVLNAFLHDRASWPLLRCCGFCGRFWVVAPRKKGRKEEYCSVNCQKKFNERGSSDAP